MKDHEILLAILNKTRASYVQAMPEPLRKLALESDEALMEHVFTEGATHLGSCIEMLGTTIRLQLRECIIDCIANGGNDE